MRRSKPDNRMEHEPSSPLFQPRAANADPATSHEAARQIADHADRQAEIVADAVKATPGLTSAELAWKHGLDRYVVARRLSEAERSGRVCRGASKVCSVTGRRALTWSTEASETRDASTAPHNPGDAGDR